jgi:lysophospholipase L1-like esterase
MKTIYILLITSILFSCNIEKGIQKEEDKKLKYLALGDSYTIGELVEEKDRWPMQLINHQEMEEYNIGKPQIIAKTGWRSDELLNSVINSNLENEYDLISIQIGVNNQYQGKSIKQFIIDLNELLDLAIEKSKKRNQGVFVVSIPNYGVTPFGQGLKKKGIGKEIKQFNKEIEMLCLDKEVAFIDIFEFSKEVKTDFSMVASDKLHPSKFMYSLWLKPIIPAVKHILDSNN